MKMPSCCPSLIRPVPNGKRRAGARGPKWSRNWRNQSGVGKGAPGRRAHKVEISPAADRDLEKLKGRIRMQDFERLRTAVRILAENPRPQGVRKTEGTEKAYRIRVGNYRFVYDVYDSGRLVLILQVARQNETTYRQ